MDFDPATGTLYLASYNSSCVAEFRTVDRATGSTTLIGPSERDFRSLAHLLLRGLIRLAGSQ